MILRSHTKQSKLPPELIDRIIDYLHDSHADLSACSCVCRAWLESSRFHLFYSISIHTAGKRESYGSLLSKCQKLSKAIRRCPSIAFHVRDLEFSTGFRYGFHLGEPGSPTRLKIEQLLPPLLQSFTRLRTLCLVVNIWRELTPDIRKSLYRLLSLPSLVQLEARQANFIELDYFTNLLRPQLKHLILSPHLYHAAPPPITTEVTSIPDVEDEEYTLPEREPCRLESLTLQSIPGNICSEFIDWVLGSQSIIDLSGVRTLDIRCNPYHVNGRYHAMELVSRLGSSLEHLTLGPNQITSWGAL